MAVLLRGKQKTEKNGLPDPQAEPPGRQKGDPGGQQDLKRPSQQDRLFNPQQLVDGELDPDGEQQQDHPDFGHDLHFVDGLDQPQSMGPGQDPRQEKADQGRHFQAEEHKQDPDGQDQDDFDVGQEGDFHSNRLAPGGTRSHEIIAYQMSEIVIRPRSRAGRLPESRIGRAWDPDRVGKTPKTNTRKRRKDYFSIIATPREVKEMPCWPDAPIITPSRIGSLTEASAFQRTRKLAPEPPAVSEVLTINRVDPRGPRVTGWAIYFRTSFPRNRNNPPAKG